jgi:hypothetical protein
MNAFSIGHAELYIYPEKVAPQDTIVSPQRIDVGDLAELVKVLQMMPVETSFSVLLVINECVVGNGKYFMTHETITVLHEYGACVGFIARPLDLIKETQAQQAQQAQNMSV